MTALRGQTVERRPNLRLLDREAVTNARVLDRRAELPRQPSGSAFVVAACGVVVALGAIAALVLR